MPLFPLHTWLPDAHTQAPTAGSVILAGVMLKLGTYGLLRFGLYLFPEAAYWARPLFLTLAVIGILYGAVVATMQKDLKRLVAYSSIAHLGFIVLGTFAITSQSMTGGVLQMINHGVSTGALFLLVGWIYERRHTRQIPELKGLQTVAPIFAAVFTRRDAVVDRRARAQRVRRRVPHPDRLVPDRPLVDGGRRRRRDPRRALPAVGLPAGVPRRARRGQQVVPPSSRCGRAPCCRCSSRLIVFIGVYPKPLLDRIEPSVDSLIVHVEDRGGVDIPGPNVVEVANRRGRGGTRLMTVLAQATFQGPDVDWFALSPILVLVGAALLLLAGRRAHPAVAARRCYACGDGGGGRAPPACWRWCSGTTSPTQGPRVDARRRRARLRHVRRVRDDHDLRRRRRSWR